MPCDDDLDRVVAQVLDGERDSFRIIVERHEPLVRGWLANHSPSHLDPDEISHLTFIAAYRSLHRYQPGTDIRAWLMGIARNLLANELRRHRTEDGRHGTLDELDHNQACASVNGIESDVDLRPVTALQDCMEHLPSDGSALLHGHYTDGKPLQELATSSGRSLTALKFRLHWLRRKLADCVEERLRD